MLTRPLIALLLALLLVGCGGASSTPSSPPAPTLEPLAARGAALFEGKGLCATCHATSGETVIVGPSLAGVAQRAESTVAGLSAHDYLEESILLPDAYRVPGFEGQQMPASLAKALTVDEVEALVAYLLTLR